MAILAILLFIIPAFTGSITWLLWNLAHEKITILIGGTFTGLSVFTLSLFGLYVFFPLSSTLILSLLSFFLCIGLSLILIASRRQIDLAERWHHLDFDYWLLGVILFISLIFSIISPKLLLVNENGGLSTGIINAYGDVAWHASNITYFVNNHAFPPEDAIFAGHPLVYPFLTNFFSSALMISGLPLHQSLTVPAIILIPLLFACLYIFSRALLRSSSPRISVLIILLFLCGGATLGFTRLPADFQQSNLSLGSFLWHLPQADYSGVGTSTDGFHFLNPSTSLLLPQRAFLFGLPLALLILYLFIIGTTTSSRPHYFFAGLLAGTLPLFHAHTIIALIPAIIIFSLPVGWHRSHRFGLFIFALTSLCVGAPGIWYYYTFMSSGSSFFRWDPGWMSTGNFIWYWFKNTGFLFPVILSGLFLPAPKLIKKLTLAGLILFIASNLFLFAPWAWDNFKLLIYFFIFSLPLFTWTLAWIWRKYTYAPLHIVLGLIVLFQISAATLDIWKLLLPTATTWEEWSQNDIAAAAMITQTTPADAVIATAAIHNSPVVLAGRARYLGYTAHIWSHGGNPWEREQSLKLFYQGFLNTLPDIAVDYVLIGPAENYRYRSLKIAPNWQLVAQSNSYQLYQVNTSSN